MKIIMSILLLVTGSGGNKTNFPKIKRYVRYINKLLSTVKGKKQSYPENIKDEIDILIATDCISEGQNLQDCRLFNKL